MPTTLDSFLVTLLVALSPFEQEGPHGSSADPSQFQQGYERVRLRPGPQDSDATGDCRYFIDARARDNCVARTSRTLPAVADATPTYPDQTVWIVPDDPGMPFRYSPGTVR